MGKINSIQELNDVMNIYLNKLLEMDPVFLDHVNIFRGFGYDFITLCDETLFPDAKSVEDLKKSLPQIRKESPVFTLELVKKYFSETYNGIYDTQIERALVDGTINLINPTEEEIAFVNARRMEELSIRRNIIRYLEEDLRLFHYDDLKKENNKEIENSIEYNEEQIKRASEFYELLFRNIVSNNKRKVNVNCCLFGDISDGCSLVHEIKHFLNVPGDKEDRMFLSYVTTEGLSDFDTMNYIDYLSGIYPEEDLNILRKFHIYDRYEIALSFNWETLLVEIYEEYGRVTPENFGEYCGEEDIDVFERMVIERDFSERLEIKKNYIFGILLSSYLHYKVRENPEFISTVVALNAELINNPVVNNGQDISAFFNRIGLDLTNPEIINSYIASELEYIMSRDSVPEIKM